MDAMASIARVIAACVIGFVSAAAGQTAQQTPQSPTIPTLNDVRPEILRLVIDDQWDRGNDMFAGRQVRPPDTLDWQAISERDHQRQSAIRALLAKGQVDTGREYHFAALIFQHSSDPEALILAHVFAVTAIIQGDSSAKWLAAATLDRYLQNDKQPQVFGTQFLQQGDNLQWTMEPYNRTAFPDGVRRLWCVVSQPEQDQALKDLQAGKSGGANTSIQECK
jgi:hypothetical protein